MKQQMLMKPGTMSGDFEDGLKVGISSEPRTTMLYPKLCRLHFGCLLVFIDLSRLMGTFKHKDLVSVRMSLGFSVCGV